MTEPSPGHRLVGSDAVAPGVVVAVNGPQGEDLVVWRSESGEACVMEARCPHQWSHLEAEGAVDGDEIVCLSHFWRFDRTGAGSKLGMTGRRDRKGDIEVLPCLESDDTIWLVP